MAPTLAEKLPTFVLETLRRYVDNHVPAGGFVGAVLENNLCESIVRADDVNLPALPAIVKYLFWEVPANCWGSPEKVAAWLSVGPTPAPKRASCHIDPPDRPTPVGAGVTP